MPYRRSGRQRRPVACDIAGPTFVSGSGVPPPGSPAPVPLAGDAPNGVGVVPITPQRIVEARAGLGSPARLRTRTPVVGTALHRSMAHACCRRPSLPSTRPQQAGQSSTRARQRLRRQEHPPSTSSPVAQPPTPPSPPPTRAANSVCTPMSTPTSSSTSAPDSTSPPRPDSPRPNRSVSPTPESTRVVRAWQSATPGNRSRRCLGRRRRRQRHRRRSRLGRVRQGVPVRHPTPTPTVNYTPRAVAANNVIVSTDAKRMTLVHQRVVGAPGRIAVLEFVPSNCWLSGRNQTFIWWQSAGDDALTNCQSPFHPQSGECQ